MIVKAAVQIKDLRQNTIWEIPCHRHSDAFYILKMMGYKKDIDYHEIDQGFLDENDKFYDRVSAWKHAWWHKQVEGTIDEPKELYSEDLW